MSYLVVDPARAALPRFVDPVLDFDPKSEQAFRRQPAGVKLLAPKKQRARIRWRILETHAHADHLSAAQYTCKAKTGA